jgi:hypothetical protein
LLTGCESIAAMTTGRTEHTYHINIFAALVRDHRRIGALADRLSRDEGDPEARDALFFQLKAELEIHTAAEHSTFYAALRARATCPPHIVDEAVEVHAAIGDLLDELSDMSGDEERWLVRFLQLKRAIEAHVHEEETELFSVAREVLDEGDEHSLGKGFEAEEKRLKTAA